MDNKLNNKEIELYKTLSGITIDLEKSKTDSQNRYWTTDKNGKSRWRTYKDIMQYLLAKGNKLTNISHNNNHNNLHNNSNNNITNNPNNIFHVNRNNVVEFIKAGKIRRLCLNLTLAPNEFNKLDTIAKKHKQTWSNIASQIVKSYLKGE